MQFTIEIDQPIQTVFNLFTDRNNIPKWQTDVNSQELVSGEMGAVSSKYKLAHKTVTIFETIIALNSPVESISEYEHQRNGSTKMFHTSTHTFTEIEENKTRLDLKVEQKVVGFFPKLVMRIFASAVKKHHQKLLVNFKELAEKI